MVHRTLESVNKNPYFLFYPENGGSKCCEMFVPTPHGVTPQNILTLNSYSLH
jgi:hypothetical protein